MNSRSASLSVVTPTFRRAEEVLGMLENISRQSVLPSEVVLVDGAPDDERETEESVKTVLNNYPFEVVYVRHGGGTAIQRNKGIDLATGDFISFIDDDIRLDPSFFESMLDAFAENENAGVGGIAGYITNQYFDQSATPRWIWYRRLGLLKTFTPGHYDYQTGIPVNRYMQPSHRGLREIDCMGAGCAVWRKEVFSDGLRFSEFFSDYGVLEDAHFALKAGKNWKLFENGKAHCTHLQSPKGRVNYRRIGYKSVVNYYYVFQDIVSPLSLTHKFRFWRYQMFELFRIASSAVRNRSWGDVLDLCGRFEGFLAVMHGVTNIPTRES